MWKKLPTGRTSLKTFPLARVFRERTAPAVPFTGLERIGTGRTAMVECHAAYRPTPSRDARPWLRRMP